MAHSPYDAKIPNSLDQCLECDNVSVKLWQWEKWLKKWGKILFFALIALGVLVSAVEIISMIDTEYEEMAITTGATTLVT